MALDLDKFNLRRFSTTIMGSVTIVLAVSACTPKTALRGNLPRDYQIEALHVGQQRMAQVEQILGSPSARGTFDTNIWYYISHQTEEWAFLGKEVVAQKVLALYFDDAGVLQHIETYTEDDAREIAASGRATPTAGKSLGFFEQIFGNLGTIGGGGSSY